MPLLEEADLLETAVLFAAAGVNRKGRQTVSSTGVEVKVRWVYKQTRVLQPDGSERSADVRLASKRNLTIGSILWLGRLADIPGTADPPVPTSDLMEVVAVNRAESIDNRHTRREYLLARYHDELPTE